jgi:KDO2-lipid IV(A) lauroyltransferase
MRNVFTHFGGMVFEIPHILRLNRDNIDHYVVFQNKDAVNKALKKEKGVFILTAHFGNWELMSAAFTILWDCSAIVVRRIDSPPFEKLLYNLRTRFGCEIIYKQKAMRQILKSVKENKAVGILLDQNVDWYEGTFVKFMGRWACVNKGLALLALKTGTPVLPIFPIRQADGRYRIIIEDEVPLIRTGDKTRDVEENTALFTSIIESYIKKYPDHWFWFHRRWKTRPYCSLPENFYTSGS